MSELDFELIDDSADQEEPIVETTEETIPSAKAKEDGEVKDTTSTKKSNWKKMSKAMKAKDKEIADLKAKLAKGDDDFEEEEEDDDDEIAFDKNEFRWFINDNPEAKEYQKSIEDKLSEFPNMSFNDAFVLVKASIPTESTSSNDFSVKSSNVKVRKKLGDLTEDEALKLPNDKYLAYQKLKGLIKR